jgi:hypothetical protein
MLVGFWGDVMRKFIVLAFALVLVGCATITKGTTQTIAIDTPERQARYAPFKLRLGRGV